MSFDAVKLQLGNLVQWVGRSGLQFERYFTDDCGKRAGVRLNYESLPPIETQVKDGSIALSFPWRWKTDPMGKTVVEHKCAFEYRFREPQPLDRVFEVCASIRNLVTICTHATSAILDTKLTHSDIDRPIDFYAQWIGTGSSIDKNAVHRLKMPFTFDDIGGLEGIRAWLDLASRYSELIAMLVSHWYAPTLYQEQRYFNAVVAAETLIRIRRNERRVNLGKALWDLAQENRCIFEPLVGDLSTWAQGVVQGRDNYVVHPGLRGSSDGYRLYLLSESIYVLVVLTLLRECRVPVDSLMNIQNHQHFEWLAAKLKASMEPDRAAADDC